VRPPLPEAVSCSHKDPRRCVRDSIRQPLTVSREDCSCGQGGGQSAPRTQQPRSPAHACTWGVRDGGWVTSHHVSQGAGSLYEAQGSFLQQTSGLYLTEK